MVIVVESLEPEVQGFGAQMARSSTLARLSLETSRSHAWIDEALFGPLEFPTSTAYRRFLCLFYGFQAPLENALALTPGVDPRHFEGRGKAGRIAHDLMALGLTRHEHLLLARRQAVPAFENAAQAVGWMYSTERLMLQVEALRVRLEVEMPVVMALAHQFLYVYVNTAELRWRQFGAVLDRVAKNYDVEQIVEAARTSLDALHSWSLAPNTIKRSATNDERITHPIARVSA